MWQSIVKWFTSLFSKSETEVEHSFSGWIKDTADSRDQIFGETK